MTAQLKVKAMKAEVIKAEATKAQQQAEAMKAAIDTALLELGKQLSVYALNSAAYDRAKENRDSAKQVIDKLIPSLSKAKVEIGELPNNKNASAHNYEFYEGKNGALIPLLVKKDSTQRAIEIYRAIDSSLSHGVKKNYISAMRICIAENKKFSLNPSRERVQSAQSEKKEKAKAAAPSDGELISIEQITTDAKTSLKTTALVALTALLKRAEKESSTEIEFILKDALEALQGVK